MHSVKSSSVCIVCFAGDAHVEIVSGILKNKYSSKITIVNPDVRMSDISIQYNNNCSNSSIEFDLVWARRKNTLHTTKNIYFDTDVFINVAQSNQDAMHEFLNQNRLRCINDPNHSVLIENKAMQLSVAIQSGFMVPPTVITSHYETLMNFYESERELIVKNMRSIGGEPTGTFIFDPRLANKESCGKSFSIYQKYIKGKDHYRVVVFGEKIFSFVYCSNNVDSRLDARNRAELVKLGTDVEVILLKFLEIAGLKMGVFDLKKSDDGELFFLEINQQGAFAYLDPLTGTPLLKEFSDFIYREAIGA